MKVADLRQLFFAHLPATECAGIETGLEVEFRQSRARFLNLSFDPCLPSKVD